MRSPLFLLVPSLLFAAKLQADPLSSSFITDQPSTKRPQLPKFIPQQASPSFTLPPPEQRILPKNKTDQAKIELKAVKFSGNTVFSEAELQKIAAPFVGKAVLVSELEDLRQAISQYYSERGYVNSGAVLPEQTFKDGIIQFEIIEGKLSEIRVHGTEWLRPEYVKDRLESGDETLLNVNELREKFQLLLLNPLIERMNGELIPGTQRGESVLEVNVTRARPYQINLSVDNYRPPSVGSEQGKLSGWIRNLTGFGDVVDWSVLYSAGSVGGSGSFSIPLNRYDTRFHFGFGISNTSVIEEPLEQLDIKSEYTSFEFGLVQPLIQTLEQNFNLSLSFNYKENSTSLLGRPFAFSSGADANGISKDSVLRFSLDFTQRWQQHVLSARSTTSVGINAFNATWHNDKQLADGDFVAWLGQLQYAGQLFDSGGTLILRSDVQFSDNKLLPMEQFALGGRYSVRGYRENEVVRDKGYLISAEFRYPLFDEQGRDSFPGQLTVFPFMDYGAGWNRGDREAIRYLHSVGIGLEWQPVSYVRSEIMYAHDLNTAAPKSRHNLQDGGVHWQVTFSAF